jgi:hypothetical protein
MEKLISTLAALIEEKDRKHFLIFGSSAIVLNGIDLGREVHDLDIFVSEQTYTNLKGRFPEKAKAAALNIVSFYEPAKNIEIWGSWPGATFDQLITRAHPTEASEDFPVVHIDDVVAWKIIQGREKDLSDIQKIEAHKMRNSHSFQND